MIDYVSKPWMFLGRWSLMDVKGEEYHPSAKEADLLCHEVWSSSDEPVRDAVVVDSLPQVIMRREEISLITDGSRHDGSDLRRLMVLQGDEWTSKGMMNNAVGCESEYFSSGDCWTMCQFSELTFIRWCVLFKKGKREALGWANLVRRAGMRSSLRSWYYLVEQGKYG